MKQAKNMKWGRAAVFGELPLGLLLLLAPGPLLAASAAAPADGLRNSSGAPVSGQRVLAPTIAGFSPASGVPGTLVTITGTSLNETTAVLLDGVPITPFSLVNATTLRFTVPFGASSGLLGVATTTDTVYTATGFCVTYEVYATPAIRCGAGRVSLQAQGVPLGGRVAWYTQASGGTAIAGATSASYFTPTLQASTTYYATISTGSGATACEGPRGAVEATIVAAPTVVVDTGDTTTVCPGGSRVLTASGAATYRWSTGATTASITVSTTGTYTVTGSSAEGCQAATNVVVRLLPQPATPTAADVRRCGPGAVTLTASGAAPGDSYLWTDTATGTTVPGGATFTTPPLTASTLYSVQVRSAGGCTSSGTAVQVTIDPLPGVTVTASGPLTICPGDSVRLTASGATAYLWNTGATTDSIWVRAGGSYAVVGSSAAGCAAAPVATTMTVAPLPATPSITQGPAGTLTSSAASGNQWYFGPTAIAGATSPTYVVTPATGNGSYTVVVTSATGCRSAASAPVAVVLGTSAAALAAGLHAWPNPAHARLTVQVPAAPGAATATAKLLDGLGRTVRTATLPLAGGARITHHAFDLAGLAPGLYLLRLTVGAATATQRLVVE